MNPRRAGGHDEATLSLSIASCERRFKETQNPAYVLEAMYYSRGETLPEWVRDYLDQLAERAYEIAHNNVPLGSVPRTVYRVLGFDARPRNNPFRAVETDAHDFHLACQVFARLHDGGEDAAIFKVAQDHADHCDMTPRCPSISYSTVARAWHAYEERLRGWPEMPGLLIGLLSKLRELCALLPNDRDHLEVK